MSRRTLDGAKRSPHTRLQESDEARELYDWGYQLSWDNIQPESTSFDAWLRGLEDELGLPRGLIKCNALCVYA